MKIIHKELKKSLMKCAVLIALFFTVYSCDELQQLFDFPFDHGPHFNTLNEWWYFTGDVLTVEKKTLGFEFTIFKRWVDSLDDFAYLGHLAVSDPDTSEHFFAEVSTSPPVTGIEEGKTIIEINNFSYTFSEAEGIIIQAEAENLSVKLSLSPTRAVLAHGQDGVIVMGDGIDSYYYSFTNLMTDGSISVNGVEYVVSSGRTWMDHQWGDYTLSGMIWDWFSLRFEDGGALMLFQFRDDFDNVVRSNWTYRSGAGLIEYGVAFSLQAARTYETEHGKCSYPIDWIIKVPNIDAEFTVSPLFDEQYLYDVKTPSYWEGLCSVEGTIDGKLVTGSAYVELTGYEDMETNGDAIYMN